MVKTWGPKMGGQKLSANKDGKTGFATDGVVRGNKRPQTGSKKTSLTQYAPK